MTIHRSSFRSIKESGTRPCIGLEDPRAATEPRFIGGCQCGSEGLDGPWVTKRDHATPNPPPVILEPWTPVPRRASATVTVKSSSDMTPRSRL